MPPVSRLLRRSPPSFGAYLLATVVTGATGVVLLPTYARALGPAAYGELDLALALAALLTALGVAGLDTALGIAHFRDEPAARPALGITALALTALFSLLATAAGILLAISIVSRIAPETGTTAATVVVLAVAAAAVLRVGQTMLRQSFRASAFLLVAIVQAVVTVGIGLTAVLVLRLGPAGAALGYAGGWLLGAVACLALVKLHRPADGTWRRDAARRLLRLGLPAAPAGLAIWTYALADRFIVAHYAGSVDLGLYAAVARVAAILGLFVAAGQLAWGPLAMSLHRHPAAGRFYGGVLLVVSVAAALAILAAAAVAPIAVPLLLGDAYAEAAPVLWLLVAAMLANGAYYLVAIGLNISERTGDITRATWLAAFANIVLSLALIPRLGYPGAAAATLASFALATVAVYVAAQRAHRIAYPAWPIVGLWLVAIAGAAAYVAVGGVVGIAALVAALVAIVGLAVASGAVREARWVARFPGLARAELSTAPGGIRPPDVADLAATDVPPVV